MCWLFRVPFRSTFGETFSYRQSYLEGLPEQERTAILAKISAKLGDPVLTETLEALSRSLNQGQKWRGLASFQHGEGYYKAAWERIPQAHLFERIPMLEMACLTVALAIVLGGLALVGLSPDPVTEAVAWYATCMIIVGFLVSFATCLSTYFQRRLYPASLFAFSDGYAACRLKCRLNGGEHSFAKTKKFQESAMERALSLTPCRATAPSALWKSRIFRPCSNRRA